MNFRWWNPCPFSKVLAALYVLYSLLKIFATLLTMENIICWLLHSPSPSFSASCPKNLWSCFWLSFRKTKYSVLLGLWLLDSLFSWAFNSWLLAGSFLLVFLAHLCLKNRNSENAISLFLAILDTVDFGHCFFEEFFCGDSLHLNVIDLLRNGRLSTRTWQGDIHWQAPVFKPTVNNGFQRDFGMATQNFV